jgi:hypothetical protein
MSSPDLSLLPPSLESLDTNELRQRLACLIDPVAEKAQWFDDVARDIAIQFCAALPSVFGDSLDRMTMWDKIASAIQSGYAKTVSGDIDLFIQHVMESIKADPARAVASEKLNAAMNQLSSLHGQERQDWLQYLATHLIPILVHARRDHKQSIEERKQS